MTTTMTTAALFEVVERMQQSGHSEAAIDRVVSRAHTHRSGLPTRLRAVLARAFRA